MQNLPKQPSAPAVSAAKSDADRVGAHTPGPWSADLDCEHPVITSLCAPHNPQVAVVCDGDPREATEANARLIAAAPEMLEALERASRELEWADKNCQIKPLAGVSTFKIALVKINAAIAKATGGAE